MHWPLVVQDGEEERLKTKLLWIGPLLATSVASVLLLVSNRAPWTNSGSFYSFVTSNRATVQIIVQILSQSLGALHVYALCSLINFRTRLRLVEIPHTLDQLQFWSDVSLQRLNWALPLSLLMVLVAFHAVILIPGAIWAGALTPVVTSIYSTSTSLIEVPQCGPASKSIWGQLTWLAPEPSARDSRGIFSYSPNYDHVGLILTQAASASSIGNHSQPVRRLDNTRYTYVGRSYGVGSSVGLVDESFAQNATRGYTYHENGYLSHVQCIQNSTSSWAISSTGYNFQDGYPNIYWVEGHLPNGNGEAYTACGLGSSDNIFVLIGSPGQNGSENMFAIAAGQNYAAFDKVQCTADFIPAEFSVSVNRTERLITTKLLANGSNVRDIDPSGQMKAITMRMPTSFSQQHACDLYTSLLGNTFTQNYAALTNATNGSTSDNVHFTDLILPAVQDSLTSMLDDTLLAFSSAQLMIAHDVYTAPVTLSSSAVRIGQSIYIYAAAAVDLGLVLLGLFELSRTRVWSGLTRLNFADLKSLVIGASEGGTLIAEEAEKIRLHYDADQGKYYDALQEDRALGKIRVRVESLGAHSRLVGVGPKERALQLEQGTEQAMTRTPDKKTGTNISELESLHQDEGGA